MIGQKIYPFFWMVILLASAMQAQVDSNFHCYLLFGQSNMAGGGAISDSAPDCDTSPRVKVLAFSDCNLSASPDCQKIPMHRTADQWYTAFPPLHDCRANLEGICPGDWFGKAMLDSVASNIKIGLIPCALSGMSLAVFLKNSGVKSTVGPIAVNGKNAYDWVIKRCKIAQQTGVIKGMLLHQGESGSGTAQTWDAMAIQIFNDLKSDLKLDTKTPAVIGQLRSDNTSPSQNNTNFNNMVNGIPAKYPNSAVASSQGLSGNGKDVWHFRPSSMRELGKRYARAVLSLTDHTFIPRKGDVTGVYNSSKSEIASTSDIFSTQKDIKIYSLSGKLIQQYASNKITGAKSLNSGHVYIVAPNSYSKTRLMVIP